MTTFSCDATATNSAEVNLGMKVNVSNLQYHNIWHVWWEECPFLQSLSPKAFLAFAWNTCSPKRMIAESGMITGGFLKRHVSWNTLLLSSCVVFQEERHLLQLCKILQKEIFCCVHIPQLHKVLISPSLENQEHHELKGEAWGVEELGGGVKLFLYAIQMLLRNFWRSGELRSVGG